MEIFVDYLPLGEDIVKIGICFRMKREREHLFFVIIGYDEEKCRELEEQTEQTSSRKRKQFCPRRLLTEKERNRREIVPSLVTAL